MVSLSCTKCAKKNATLMPPWGVVPSYPWAVNRSTRPGSASPLERLSPGTGQGRWSRSSWWALPGENPSKTRGVFYTKAPGKTKARDATGFDIFWKIKYGSADEKEQVTRWIKMKHLTYQLYPLFDGVFYRCSIQHCRFKFSGKCVETLAIHCQQVMQIRCMWYL